MSYKIKFDTITSMDTIYIRAIDMSYQIDFNTALTMPVVAFDIGCGSAELSTFINNAHVSGNYVYAGIDNSKDSIKLAHIKNVNVACIDIFNYKYTNECVYFILDILDNIDDRLLLSKLPRGCIVVSSILFDNINKVEDKYKHLIDIQIIEYYQLNNTKWVLFGGTIK